MGKRRWRRRLIMGEAGHERVEMIECAIENFIEIFDEIIAEDDDPVSHEEAHVCRNLIVAAAGSVDKPAHIFAVMSADECLDVCVNVFERRIEFELIFSRKRVQLIEGFQDFSPCFTRNNFLLQEHDDMSHIEPDIIREQALIGGLGAAHIAPGAVLDIQLARGRSRCPLPYSCFVFWLFHLARDIQSLQSFNYLMHPFKINGKRLPLIIAAVQHI